MTQVTVKVGDIKAGDTLAAPGGWRAVADAETLPDGSTTLRVQYSGDGGMGSRHWDAALADHELTLER